MSQPLTIERGRTGVRAQAARRRRGRTAAATLLGGIALANVGVIIWMWWHGGNVTGLHSTGDVLTSIARLTGLLSAYLALVQVVLLARLPWLERLVGFDRLGVWHRWNGHACLDLVLAHVLFSIWGYSVLDRYSIGKEISTMITGGLYPGMITATIGTALMVLVVFSSIQIARRALPYQWWYAVHLSVYAAIALAWFHQIPTGNELVNGGLPQLYWKSLYVATIVILVVFRLLVPIVNAFRYRLVVSDVVRESDNVVSLVITGRRLDRLGARAGQFFLWRFLDRQRLWAAHPFSLSEAPNGRTLRITVKTLGDFTRDLRQIEPGTRVVVEGPFGVFTADASRGDRVLLVAGGIGITPIRAMMEELRGDVIVLYRVVTAAEAVLRDELETIARRTGAVLHVLVGDHNDPEGAKLLSPSHLRELVPDVRQRDVFLCGPPGMVSASLKNVRALDVPRARIHTERFAY